MMRLKGKQGCCFITKAFVLFLVGVSFSIGASAQEPSERNQKMTLRLNTPLPDLVRELEAYIPDRMKEANIPGLSVVLIKDKKIVWNEGFGSQNDLYNKPVTQKTIFEVGSISKPVAAFGVLKLAELGVVDLDTPLDHYLTEPWLQGTLSQGKITARHILTHTSGLTNNVRSQDRKVLFPSGEYYSYSGMGFIYLQHVLERISGQSIDAIMTEQVFQPLGMFTASYDPKNVGNGFSAGHMPLTNIVLYFVLPMVGVGAILLLIVLSANRVRQGQWVVSKGSVITVSVISALLIGGMLATSIGGALTFSWVMASIIYLMTILVFFLCARWMFGRFFAEITIVSGFWRQLTSTAIFGVIGGALYFASPNILVPVPGAPIGKGSIAWSLHSTAEDIGLFAIALMELESVELNLAQQLIEPQVTLDDGSFWGMGIGLREGEAGRSFYHVGLNPGFEAILIGFPEQGAGVVVLTNVQGGIHVARDIAVLALGKEADLGNNLQPLIK